MRQRGRNEGEREGGREEKGGRGARDGCGEEDDSIGELRGLRLQASQTLGDEGAIPALTSRFLNMRTKRSWLSARKAAHSSTG